MFSDYFVFLILSGFDVFAFVVFANFGCFWILCFVICELYGVWIEVGWSVSSLCIFGGFLLWILVVWVSSFISGGLVSCCLCVWVGLDWYSWIGFVCFDYLHFVCLIGCLLGFAFFVCCFWLIGGFEVCVYDYGE